jgi:hypothetical protein
MRFGRGVHPVNRFGGDVHRGIEPEGEVGAGEVVIDGLGDAYHVNAFFVQLLGDRKRVVAADSDQSFDLVFLQRGHAFFQAICLLRRIGAGSAQDSAAAGKYSAHTGEIERHALVFDQPAPALEKAHKFVFVVKTAFTHHGADHGVQPWAVAAAGEYANFHCLLLIVCNMVLRRSRAAEPTRNTGYTSAVIACNGT